MSTGEVSRKISMLLVKIEMYCRQFETEERIKARLEMLRRKGVEQKRSMETSSITFLNTIPIPVKYAVPIKDLGLSEELVHFFKNRTFAFYSISTNKCLNGPIHTLYELIEALRCGARELTLVTPRKRDNIIYALKSVGIELSKYNQSGGLDLKASFLATFRDEMLEAKKIAQYKKAPLVPDRL